MIRKQTLVIYMLGFSSITAMADVINLEQISVTGLREEEKVSQQALSISKKSTAEIELDQVIFQKDLLNSISGVRIEQTGSVIGHTTSIRMPSGTGPYYLFLQDGIPAQSSGFFNHNGLAYTTYNTSSSVEVLKGSGTALYGSDAVGGIVNVQSASRPSKDLERKFKFLGGSDGFVSSFAEVSNTIDSSKSYRVNGSYSKGDGWREHSEFKRFEGNIRYDHIISDENFVKTIFNTSFTNAQQADSFNNYSNISSGSSAASDDTKYFTALNSTDIRRKFDYVKLSSEWSNYSYNDLEITTTPYIRYNRNRYVATWQSNLPSNDNDIFTIGLLQKNDLEKAWGNIIFGFDTEYTDSSLNYNQTFDTSSRGKNYVTGALYDYDVKYLAFAPYFNVDWNTNEKLKLTFGARYDYNHYDYTNNLTTGTDASGVYYRPDDRKDSFNHFSPKFSLLYKATKELNLFVRYSNGFRIPQATRLYSMKSGYKEASLSPETTDSYEIGIKKEYFKRGYAELIAYYMSIDDTITSQRVKAGDDFYYNGGKSIHKGIELTLLGNLSDEISTKIAYSYSKHAYRNDAKFNDDEMASAPNHIANIRLFYTPKVVNNLTVMGEYIYLGSYWMDDLHTMEYDGYKVANIKINYKTSKNFSILGKVTNIADKQYATRATYGYGREDYTPGDPRQFYVGLEYKW